MPKPTLTWGNRVKDTLQVGVYRYVAFQKNQNTVCKNRKCVYFRAPKI